MRPIFAMKGSRRLVRVVGDYAANWICMSTCAATIMATALLLASCVVANDGYVPRTLDLQTILKYDELFFNEVDDPLNPSNRYGDDWQAARKRDFERMAAAGYAPAIAFLHVWDMDKRARKDFSPAPFEMLKQRALGGDVSAACALWPVHSWGGQRDRRAGEVQGEFRPFINVGVKAGHFACQYQAAVEPSVLAGKTVQISGEHLDLLLDSAAQGYYRAHWVLALSLSQAIPLSAERVDQALCWSLVADQSRRAPMRYHLTRTFLHQALKVQKQTSETLLNRALARWPESNQSTHHPTPRLTVDQCMRLHGR